MVFFFWRSGDVVGVGVTTDVAGIGVVTVIVAVCVVDSATVVVSGVRLVRLRGSIDGLTAVLLGFADFEGLASLFTDRGGNGWCPCQHLAIAALFDCSWPRIFLSLAQESFFVLLVYDRPLGQLLSPYTNELSSSPHIQLRDIPELELGLQHTCFVK